MCSAQRPALYPGLTAIARALERYFGLFRREESRRTLCPYVVRVNRGDRVQDRSENRGCDSWVILATIIGASEIETGNCAVVGRRHCMAENLASCSARQFRALGESTFTRPAGGGSEEGRAYRALVFENKRLKRLLGERELNIAVLRGLIENDPQTGGRFAVADNRTKQGHKARILLRAVGPGRSTYYRERNNFCLSRIP